MSGIFGTGRISAVMQRETNADIERLWLWNRPYGTDAEQTLCRTDYVLGCCYERVADRNENCTPVLKYGENIYAVIDAVIYNVEEICARYGVAVTLSYEEILLHIIMEHGYMALRDVNGDFSGAVYNIYTREWLLFRDHMGVRPLFYYTDRDKVVFSTDIRGILAIDTVDAAISEDWLYRTCVGSIQNNNTSTEYQHIFCVKPASCLTISPGEDGFTLSEKIYWRLREKKIRYRSEEEYQHRLRELVENAIKIRLDITTGRVGAELSGGLDSGVIDVLINRMGRECLYHSWSIAPEQLEFAENDERYIVDDLCRQEKINCHYSQMEEKLDEDSLLVNNLQNMGLEVTDKENMILRYVLPPYCNTFKLSLTSQYMKQNGVKVVFTGHGGDEGVSHRCNSYEMFYHREYLHFFQYLWECTKGEPNRPEAMLRSCYHMLIRKRRELRKPFRSTASLGGLLNQAFADQYRNKKMPALHFSYSPIEYIEEGGSRNRLDNIALQGAFSGVRYLIPYLDYRLIDYAVSIPRHMYLKHGENRYIFRETFKDILPDSLYHCRTKSESSYTKLPDEMDYAEKHRKEKEELLAFLDKEYWKKYLNFDTLREWVVQEQLPQDMDWMQLCIVYCAMAQNLVDKSRQVKVMNQEIDNAIKGERE